MKKNLLFLLSILFFISCNTQKDNKNMDGKNPFFSEYNTPFSVPPFNQISISDYMPAFREGIRQHDEKVNKIASNTSAPDFSNTIAALDYSGELLTKVSSVFFNLTSSNTSDELQKIAKEVSPLLSQHGDNILLNADLFKRVKAVYEQKDALDMNQEQKELLKKTYDDFVRGGANLSRDDQEKLREINKKLSLLSLKFGDNVLAETNAFQLVIDRKEDLAGLPEAVVNAAAQTAKEAGQEGKWVFTLQKPSLIPFLQYSEKRGLREKIFEAYINRGDQNNEFDNKENVSEMVSLRAEKAQLLGYKNHASYVLEESMAKNPENVYKLLNQVMNAALPVAKREAADLQKMIDKEGEKFKLQPWDWWYYAEKLRKEKYDLDEETLRPYFELENVRKGLFDVVNKLYGLKIEEITGVPKYHEDVRVFEVKEADGRHVGIVYMDFFPRASKRGGAWMNNYREEYKKDGKKVAPVVTTVFNFTKPSGDKPALLSFEEASTMFHEFGHALHSLLTDCTYPKLSGTNVPRDFVELPSQVMENWAAAPEVIKTYAKHYETGEPIPDEMVAKIKNSSHFNQGFATVEYLAASYLDMDWHTIEKPGKYDVDKFEDESMQRIHMIPQIVVRYRSTYFSHIFSGGYSAGYYSYIWAEVLDSDAFEAFKETGNLFDPATALSFRKNILEKGGTDDPMTLYVNFRGEKPGIKPLLKKRGLK